MPKSPTSPEQKKTHLEEAGDSKQLLSKLPWRWGMKETVPHALFEADSSPLILRTGARKLIKRRAHPATQEGQGCKFCGRTLRLKGGS